MEKLLNDPRDLPLLKMAAQVSIFPILAIALFMPGIFSWKLGAAYLALYFYYLAPFVTMFHDVNHHKLFKKPYSVFNHWINWVVGPIFGSTPETYFVHHVGMHHPEENLEADISSTLPYQRNSFKDFARYYFRFFFSFGEMLRYLLVRKRYRLARRLVFGELVYFLVAGGAFWLNWKAALVTFGIPLWAGRSVLIIGNWAEHAFIDPLDPENAFRSSTNLIGEKVNSRCFNVGYHIGHHLFPRMHFTDTQKEFEANLERYAREDALVFRDLHYPDLWFYLMTKNYRKLARAFVSLPGAPPRSETELLELFHQRLAPIALSRRA